MSILNILSKFIIYFLNIFIKTFLYLYNIFKLNYNKNEQLVNIELKR